MLARPVIVARRTNMDRIVEHAACGLVVEYGDTTELEAALVRLQNEPDLRWQLGQNGYQAYQSTYSWAEMEKRLVKLYAEVAS